MIAANVMLWGRRIGAVVEENGIARFNYDTDFLYSGIELSPLMMPLGPDVYYFPDLEKVKPFYGIPGLLADSLPGSFGHYMFREYLDRFDPDRKELSPVEKLCYIGKRGMGALEFDPTRGPEDIRDSLDIVVLRAMAESILTEKKDQLYKDNAEGLKLLYQIGSSAGGARAKAIIAWNEETNDIRSGQINAGEGYGYWILKFGAISNNKDQEEKPDDIDSTQTEYAYYRMALKAGIDMSESRLYNDGEAYHFITRRFDRKENGSKLHMMSLCGLTHLDFAAKSAYDYSLLADVFPRLNLGNEECEKMFRRMVFNDMAYNYDDHIKNISFLMDKDGIWKLSPAYDMTYAHDINGRYTDVHQMRINGKNQDITIEDYKATGKIFGIKNSTMNSIIEEVREAVKCFGDLANDAGVRDERIVYIKKQIDSKL